ncbi:MAG: LamG domain-containing protein [Mesorhizobium sp.]|uniref:LamG domain-containing protein n=1 Tax=Mesorhizobium sp. TaxID=1871066 RepID=UPI000FE55827|nr:LamG domain-containing protein [Mesorhizobium sp.]RWD33353.1 MAG: LamG domain-containing protein [Mesorhizobium sp.]TJW69310.1 MAG: LamG domain-containing protein [Mesorhizobium sp.]
MFMSTGQMFGNQNSGGGGGGSDFSKVMILLGWEDADGTTSITDESAAPHTFTEAGNAQIDTAQFKFGASSGLFDGSGDEWNCPANANLRLSQANSDQFTVETWIRPASGTTFTNHSIIGQGDTDGNLSWKFMVVDGGLRFSFSPSGSGWTNITTAAFLLGTGSFVHAMVDKDATGKIRLYVNGTMQASSTPADSSFHNSTDVVRIGMPCFGGDPMNGHLDELRVTVGKAWCGNDAGFTPPTAAFPRS